MKAHLHLSALLDIGMDRYGTSQTDKKKAVLQAPVVVAAVEAEAATREKRSLWALK